MQPTNSGFRGFVIVRDKDGNIKADNYWDLPPDYQTILKEELKKDGRNPPDRNP